MSPAQFEVEIANMFNALGYRAQVVGGANDGGIDVVAHKDGKKYYIQCKKFMAREVTPHDVRDFLGAITNANNPADQGFFVTTGGFTLMAKEAAKRKSADRAHRWPQARRVLQDGPGKEPAQGEASGQASQRE